MHRESAYGKSLSVLPLLDETVDYLRHHGMTLAPTYLLCSLPFAVAGLVFLDTAASKNEAGLPFACLLLIVTAYVRWFGCAAVQRKVVAKMSGGNLNTWRAMLPSFLWLRLFGISEFAGPIALDSSAAKTPLSSLWRLKRENGQFFRRYLCATILFSLIIVLHLLLLRYFLSELLLPYVLGFDYQMFRAVLYSRFWVMGMFMMLYLGSEFFYLVSGTLIYQALCSRWTGADLYRRMGDMLGDD